MTLLADLERELRRAHGADWRTPVPEGAPATETLAAWERDAARIAEAAERLEARRMGELVAWHERELARLRANGHPRAIEPLAAGAAA